MAILDTLVSLTRSAASKPVKHPGQVVCPTSLGVGVATAVPDAADSNVFTIAQALAIADNLVGSATGRADVNLVEVGNATRVRLQTKVVQTAGSTLTISTAPAYVLIGIDGELSGNGTDRVFTNVRSVCRIDNLTDPDSATGVTPTLETTIANNPNNDGTYWSALSDSYDCLGYPYIAVCLLTAASVSNADSVVGLVVGMN
jgi:hypothetical protein